MTWQQRSLLIGGVALVLTAGISLIGGCCGGGVSLAAGALAGYAVAAGVTLLIGLAGGFWATLGGAVAGSGRCLNCRA